MIEESLPSTSAPSYKRRCCSTSSSSAWPAGGRLTLTLMDTSFVSGCSGDAGPQRANGLNLQFDDVAWLQIAIQFEPASASDRSGSQDIAGIDGLAACDVADHLGKAPVDRAEPALGPDLPVDPGNHDEGVEV